MSGRKPPRYVDVCLVDARRTLSFKVPYTGNGPFWALADGSCFLKPWGCLNRFHPLREGFYFLLRYKYIVVQNLFFSFQPSLALRQRLNRVQEADLSASADVKLVVHSDSHHCSTVLGGRLAGCFDPARRRQTFFLEEGQCVDDQLVDCKSFPDCSLGRAWERGGFGLCRRYVPGTWQWRARTAACCSKIR